MFWYLVTNYGNIKMSPLNGARANKEELQNMGVNKIEGCKCRGSDNDLTIRAYVSNVFHTGYCKVSEVRSTYI